MVYLPTTAAEMKLHELRKRGADVVQHGSDFVDAEKAAYAAAAAHDLTYVSAYNDLQVAVERAANISTDSDSFSWQHIAIEGSELTPIWCLTPPVTRCSAGGGWAGDHCTRDSRGAAFHRVAHGLRPCWRWRADSWYPPDPRMLMLTCLGLGQRLARTALDQPPAKTM